MTTRTRQERRESAQQIRRRLNRQKGECTWCGKPVGSGRRSWCSQDCVDEFLVRNSPGHLRSIIERRDRGICCRCGADTLAQHRVVRRLRREHSTVAWAAWKELVAAGWPKPFSHCWEADHVVPFADGGETIPENIRTLCIPCHKEVTAEFAAERARRRKESAQ